ncbi:MAG: molybdenum ABC transporter ATP-binding protein [Paracoccus denitrificans]|nr:MAG: molybdenum ABC transporter ATP-binding protein [Paracoccus denitrificans]PZO83048.1 MAG: molybdenum ABC transporter ATP-binding protein [Paracoccus denitrificans]
MLEVSLRHRFSGFDLDARFTAPSGLTALFGPSGAGKTTIVNAVSGLLRPDYGRIVVGDRVLLDTDANVFVPTRKRRIGYVFQEGRLFPHLIVRQNLTYGARFLRNADRPPVGPVVDMLGIGALLDRRPATLSGGERSRVGIGRALLSGPDLLIMDEPLAALDDARRQEIMPYLERLRDAAKVPILYISHSVSEVARLATTLVAVDRGRVVAAGPLAEVAADPDLGLAQAGDAGAVLGARVVGIEADGLTRLETVAGPLFITGEAGQVGRTLQLRIRAADVTISLSRPTDSSALNILPAVVDRIVPTANAATIRLTLGDDAAILARITRRSVDALALRPGVPCHATIKSVALG